MEFPKYMLLILAMFLIFMLCLTSINNDASEWKTIAEDAIEIAEKHAHLSDSLRASRLEMSKEFIVDILYAMPIEDRKILFENVDRICNQK